MKQVMTMLMLTLTASPLLAQAKGTVKLVPEAKFETKEFTYKKTTEGSLLLHGYFPSDWKASDKRAGVVFFFGGGWKNGVYTQFVPQSEYFATRGLVCLCADYRIESKHKTTPDAAVEDAKSAIRWVRAHASELGIDPEKIIASGGSAGGHIAACTALVEGFNAAQDEKVSSIPSALLLFNPALNLTKGPIKNAKGEDIAAQISPTKYLKEKTPPTWLVYGDADAALAQGQEYAQHARKLGISVELLVAPQQPHGFFNRSPWIESTTVAADAWLVEKGYLRGSATLKPSAEAMLKKQ